MGRTLCFEMSLTTRQISHLRSLGQKLEPILVVGKNGLSEAFLKSVAEILQHNELIKIRLGELKEQRKTIAPELAAKTGCELVTLVGHVVVLYRQNPDPTKQKIVP
ncbi:MAG: YhbY family RNA-binding protein [Verrucomicrobia bacterium]|nr:MAG: YhbY family RNA-binding protein [Verrucomicrobiota bacterium]